MNILHVTPHVTIRGGGLATAALELAEAQSRLQHRVVVNSTEAMRNGESATASFEVLTSPAIGPDILTYSRVAERWAHSATAAEFDVLHQHGIWSLFSRVTTRWREKHGKPTLVAPHGSFESWALRKSPWKKRLALLAYESKNLRDASCLQATTDMEVEGMRAFGLTNPIAVIPNGVSEDWLELPAAPEAFRARHNIPAERRLFLFLSRLHRKKGLADLVDAFAAGGHALRDWDLVLAGPEDDPGYTAGIRNEIARHGLEHRIHFVGVLNKQQKRDAFAASDLFVLPTYSDNFAIVIAEALGSGVPVLTAEGAIAWRSIERDGCGWCIPNGAADLTDKLREIAQLPPGTLGEMGARGVQLVRQKFLWSHAAEKSIEVYRWLVGETGRPGYIIS